MFNFSTLPSNVSQGVKLMPDIVRRESVEIVAETILKTPTPSRKRKFSTRSKSTSSRMPLRYQAGLTPSRAFKWTCVPEASRKEKSPTSRYFHAICFNIICSCT